VISSADTLLEDNSSTHNPIPAGYVVEPISFGAINVIKPSKSTSLSQLEGYCMTAQTVILKSQHVA
jgi:hypothetical protein